MDRWGEVLHAMAADVREIKRLVQDLALTVARHEERLASGAATLVELRERIGSLEDANPHHVTTTECRRQHDRAGDDWRQWARLIVSAVLGAGLATGVTMLTR